MINLEEFISKYVTERDSSLFEREKQQIRSNRIINHISKSVLAVLLIHGSSIIEPLLASQFNYLRESFSGILLVFFWFVGVVVIFLVSIVIDQIRLLSYHVFSEKLFFIIEKVTGKLQFYLDKKCGDVTINRSK